MTNVTLKLNGMSCGHCVHAVDTTLKGLPGVEVAKVDIGSAVISFDAGKVSLEQIKAAVAEEGYEVVGTSA